MLPGLMLTLEPVEYKGLDGHPLPERKRSDIGDQVVILTVRDLELPMAAAKKAGLKIVTRTAASRSSARRMRR